MKIYGSKEIAASAIRLAMTADRAEESQMKLQLKEQGISAVAVDYGGEFVGSIAKIVERAVIASVREGIISEAHKEEGAVLGAAHEALTQIMQKAMGLNVGGKIAVARHNDHISVAIFFAVGLLHLNDVTIGLGHRVV